MPVTASAQYQLKLLELAKIDTKIIQLDHQRLALPEIKSVQDLEVELGSIEMRIVAAQTEVSDLTQAQNKAESDVEQVQSRIDRDQKKLDEGTGSAKDLENLQHELSTLAIRLKELEDVELEVMQQLDDAQNALAELTTEKNVVATKLADTRKALEVKLSEIESAINEIQVERTKIVQILPTDLADLYEKIRAERGDVGAAEMTHGACQGCHLAIDATELNRIKDLPEDSVVRCEECRRILVRAKG